MTASATPTCATPTAAWTEADERAWERVLADAARVAVVDDWAGADAAGLADALAGLDGPPDDDAHSASQVPAANPSDRAVSNATLLATAAALPAGQRGAVLVRVDIAALDGWGAEELLRLSDTVAAAALALQVRARLAVADHYGRLRAEELARRDARDAAARAAGERVPARREVVDHTISAIMKVENISRAAAEGRLAQARDCRDRLPQTFALLEGGQISPDHLRMVRSELATLETPACQDAEARLLRARAYDLTPGEAAKSARHVAAVVDEEAFARRHAYARHDRRAYVRPLPDGMAQLSAIGPAEHVARAFLEIDEHARRLRAAGDPRTLEQLRCDLLLGAPAPPAGLAMDTPIAGISRFDPRTGEVRTETWYDTDEDGPPETGEPSTGAARWRTFQGRPVTTVLVIDLATYLGGDDLPALIQGVGPIPAAVARELAHGSRAWFRAAVDDSGVCRDYGRLRAPRQDLRDLVIRGRGLMCACGCGQPATAIDHDTEFRHGGTTSEDNLDGLATRCHVEKTDAVETRAGWTPRLDGEGTVTWTSPFGHERAIGLSDLGLRSTRRTYLRVADSHGPPPPPRPYDPSKPFHPILNAPPLQLPAANPAALDPDEPPPF